MTTDADTALARDLVERYQRGFPVTRRPFAEIGHALGRREDDVVDAFRDLAQSGKISRLGAVVRPHAAGASTLAAMAVPDDRLLEIARLVSAIPGVNHNYERENAVNLWFVLHAPNGQELSRQLDRIAALAGYPVLDLRLETEYRIDLGFSMTGATSSERAVGAPHGGIATDPADLALLRALEGGLPLAADPYGPIADWAGLEIDDCILRLRSLIERGIVRRFGVVVNHRAYGYVANAMAVWDAPDEHVEAIGRRLAREADVTLCYRRARRPPAWPYNLYAMIHGRDRGAVETRLQDIATAAGLRDLRSVVLFSRQCFKQTGARREAA